MFRRQFASLGLSMLATTACATANRTGIASGTASRSAVESREPASKAHGRLQLALEKRDTARVAAALHADAMLIVGSRDTVRGRADVARFLTSVASDSVQTVRFGRARFEPCLAGGVLEYDGDFSSAQIPGLEGEQWFAILWSGDGEQVSARRVVMAADRRTVQRASSCRFEYLVRATQRRLTISGTAEMNFGSSSAPNDVLRVMRADSLTFAALRPTPGPEGKPYPFVKRGSTGVGASVRYRFQPAYSAELQLSYRFPETVVGLNNAIQRYVAAERAPVTLAALAQMRYGLARVGVGPALLLDNWTVLEEHRRTYASETKSYWADIPPEPQSTHAWAPAFGGTLELAFMVPMSRQLLAEARASIAAFGKSDVPATETFSGASVSNRLMKVGLSIGMGW